MLTRLLAHRLTKDLSIDDPRTTELRKKIIKDKKFLFRIYDEWYRLFLASIPEGDGKVIEIGSGGGFFKEYYPSAITSDVFECPGIDTVFDACQRLPFEDGELKAIVAQNVFHHLPDPAAFLQEVQRCLRHDGVLVMIEPWVSSWARFVYTKLHHEPYNEKTVEWRIPATGPLSGANTAMPWIVFQRDLAAFNNKFPRLHLLNITPFMPFSYILSGGVSLRSLLPGFLYGFTRGVERLLTPFANHVAMFALIKIKKQ